VVTTSTPNEILAIPCDGLSEASVRLSFGGGELRGTSLSRAPSGRSGVAEITCGADMTTHQPHRRAIILIKAVHTTVFLVELASIAWLVISGLLGRRDRSVAVAGSLVAIEATVFVANSGVCPLTPLTERLGETRGSVSDIFLPERLARSIPTWSSALVAFGIVLHAGGLAARVRRGPRTTSASDVE
jgi:hypothetical protein